MFVECKMGRLIKAIFSFVPTIPMAKDGSLVLYDQGGAIRSGG